MEEVWSWSMRRWRMYNDCPRQYDYHYHQSLYQYHEDDCEFGQRLYESKKRVSEREAHYRASVLALVEMLFQGSKNNVVNEVYHNKFFEEFGKCSDKAAWVQRFAKSAENLLRHNSFSWLKMSTESHCVHRDEFLNFASDGVNIDIHSDLIRLEKGLYRIYVLRPQQYPSRFEIAVHVYFLIKVYLVPLEDIEVVVFLYETNGYKKVQIEAKDIFELRERIMESAPLLNNFQNDFPITKDEALCEHCKFKYICER